MELPAGSYEVEASASGHATKTETVAHGTAPTLHRMVLSPLGQPFTVQVNPANARVRILNAGLLHRVDRKFWLPYRVGMELAAGSYEVEASAPGYATKAETVAHGSAPTLHRMVLSPLDQPFTVRTEPADALVRLLNTGLPYRAGMELAAGSYEVEASAPGYATKTEAVAHGALPTLHRMTLSPLGQPFTVLVEPVDARVRLLDRAQPYRPGMLLWPGSYRVEVSAEGYETATENITHRAGPTVLRVALQAKPVSPAGYFTRGSNKDDVLRLQGTPSGIQRYSASRKEVWSYGYSSVEIDIRTNTVLQWSNISRNLKAKLLPGGNTTNAPYFTRGSHSDDVLRLQGTPSGIQRYSAPRKEVWSYGYSSVEIDIRTNTVLQWSNISRNLKAKLLPGGNMTNAPYFTRGSYSDDVLRLQGTPSGIQRYSASRKEVWSYGYSSVEIDMQIGTVLQWSNIAGNLKVRM